ncbi:MAG: glucose-1-phosphate thymidylyltransferase [Nanoarchaeota archaeon]|nr:glucose-1-phosphate thymidylyltransferase [Nanoarchaeota archaeon]
METKPSYFFKKIKDFCFPEIFDVENVWEILKKKNEVLSKLKPEIKGSLGKNVHFEGNVVIEEGTRVLHNCIIEGPVFIGKNCVIGPNAHIRGSTMVGDNCKIGKAEIKGSVIMNNVRADHFGYVGDSVLGDSSHLGAGVVTANFRFDGKNVKVNGKDIGLRKFGAVVGDNTQVGVNATLFPGTLIGSNSWIYPGAIVRGFIPENVIVKHNEIIKKIGPGGI